MSHDDVDRRVDEGARRNAKLRRRIDDVFGDDLPESTSDDRDEAHKGDSQEWYRAQRPPHYE